MEVTTLALSVGGALVLFQAYVTYRVTTSLGLTIGQKIAQCALIWVLPLIGAVIVHITLGFDFEPRQADRKFTSQAPNDGGGPGD